MKRIFLAIGIIILLATVTHEFIFNNSGALVSNKTGYNENTSNLTWNSYDRAQLQSKNFFFFTQKRCVFCKAFLNDANDPNISGLLSKYNLFMVEKEKDSKIADHFGVWSYPTFLVVSENETVLSKREGYPGKDFIISFLGDSGTTSDWLNELENKDSLPSAEQILSLMEAATREEKNDVFLKWANILRTRYHEKYVNNEESILARILIFENTPGNDEKIQHYIDQFGYCNEYTWWLRDAKRREYLLDKKPRDLMEIYDPYLRCKTVPFMVLRQAVSDAIDRDVGGNFENIISETLLKNSDALMEVSDLWLAKISFKLGNYDKAREYAKKVLPNALQYENINDLIHALDKMEGQ